MALTLMPDGKTFKKLNAVQEKALKNYYNRLHDKPLTETLGIPIGLAVLGGIGALAYIFRDEIKKEFEEQEKAFVDWLKGLPAKVGVGFFDLGFDIGKTVTGTDLTKPSGEAAEVFGPDVSICSQYEYDLINLRNRDPFWPWEIAAVGLGIREKLKGMKKEGCSKPPFIDQDNWDRA